jgi:hypothetical protein
MNLLRSAIVQRLVAAATSLALILSGVSGCATKPTYHARIDGIVVDQQRLAGAEESGMLTVTRDGAAFVGRAGMELRRGDRIATGPRAEAVIRWASGSALYVRPASSGRIGSFFDTLGEVFAKIRGRFEVETTFVRAGAKGTSYLVRAAAGGETTVIVFEGSVSVDSTRGAWPPVTLGAGQMVIAHPQVPRRMSASEAELQSTRDWVERLERQVPQQTSSTSTETAVAAAGIAIAVAAILASRSRSRDSAPPPQTTDPASSGRTTPAGTDRGATQQPQPKPLAAPTGLTPDRAQIGGRTHQCTGPMTFRWNAVDGARGYDVRVERLDEKTRRWQQVMSTNVTATQLVVDQNRLGTQNRWTVQARDGSRTGPGASAGFGCQFYVLR